MESTQTQTPTAAVAAQPIGRALVIHLADDLGVVPVPIGETFWTHAGATLPEMAEGRIVCVSDYTATWSWWECHPVGDELVYLLSGDVDFLLDDGHGSEAVTLRPGEGAVVPAGTWHRAVIRDAGRILFITPTPARTLVRGVNPEDKSA